VRGAPDLRVVGAGLRDDHHCHNSCYESRPCGKDPLRGDCCVVEEFVLDSVPDGAVGKKKEKKV